MLASIAIALAPTLISPPPATGQVDPALFQSMRYRNIGPFRGGRVTTVAGVPGQTFTFYMGATGGGVWKTTDAGYVLVLRVIPTAVNDEDDAEKHDTGEPRC